MPRIFEYGMMCSAVYGAAPQVPGWTTAHFRAGLGTGLQAAAFTRGSETVIAFKGTSPTNVNDLIADMKLGTGMNTSYFWDAEVFVGQYASGDAVSVTGHSLGGAIAQIVGNRRRLPFVTFNAPGVALVASRNVLFQAPWMTAVRMVGGTVSAIRHPIQMLRDVRSAFYVVNGRNYRLSGDVVSAIGVHYGNVITLRGSGNPGAQHRMSSVNEALGTNLVGEDVFP